MSINWFAFARVEGGLVEHYMQAETLQDALNYGYAEDYAVLVTMGQQHPGSEKQYIFQGKLYTAPIQEYDFLVWSEDKLAWVDPRSSAQIAADKATALEAQWAAVRYTRDQLITATDWVLIKAAEEGTKAPTEYVVYRQSLRDITLQADPYNITWPSKPE